MYEVLVSGLEITGHHGVTDEERSQGCRLKIDVCAEVEGSADVTDRIRDTVDYAELCALMVEVSCASSYKTLERLSAVFCEEAFNRFASIRALEVQIVKLDPPVPHKVGSLGVRLSVVRPG